MATWDYGQTDNGIIHNVSNAGKRENVENCVNNVKTVL